MLITKATSEQPKTRRRVREIALAALAAGVLIGAPRTARADDVSPTGKGIAGCALLGGEIVVFGEALFGVRSSTAYLIGAGAGAVAGGVGGYFVEQSVSDGRIPSYLLAGGLALIIPAVVIALDQTRYVPDAGLREDKPVNVPPAEPGKPGTGAVLGAEPPAATPAPSGTPATPAPSSGTPPTPPASTPPATPPTPAPGGAGGGGTQGPAVSLVDVHGGNLRMGVPVPQVRPLFTASEQRAYGVESKGSELRFPVMKVTF